MTPQRPLFDTSAFAPLPGDEPVRPASPGPVASPTPVASKPVAATPPAGAPVGPQSIILTQESLSAFPRLLRQAIAAQARRLPSAPLAKKRVADTGYTLNRASGVSVIDEMLAAD